MITQPLNQDKSVAALVHLSTLSKFFFPFGNFIFPLIFWTAKKNDPFVNEHAKQALNFQISLFLYVVFLITIAIAGAMLIVIGLNPEGSFLMEEHYWLDNPLQAKPVIIYIMVMALLLLSLLVLDIYAVVSATVKAGEGKLYKYPLTINFLGAENISPEENPEPHINEREENPKTS